MTAESTKEIWNEHYTRQKSTLLYPDENLVRILSKAGKTGKALDFGAGSGRHTVLLRQFGFDAYACDYTENAVAKIRNAAPDAKVDIVSDPPYPYGTDEFDVLVSWGVLHYNSLNKSREIIKEYLRVLKPGGLLAGTVRSDRDSFLEVNGNTAETADIKGAFVKLYSLDEVTDLLQDFKKLEMGYMERSPVGDIGKRICHWIFKAEK